MVASLFHSARWLSFLISLIDRLWSRFFVGFVLCSVLSLGVLRVSCTFRFCAWSFVSCRVGSWTTSVLLHSPSVRSVSYRLVRVLLDAVVSVHLLLYGYPRCLDFLSVVCLLVFVFLFRFILVTFLSLFVFFRSVRSLFSRWLCALSL